MNDRQTLLRLRRVRARLDELSEKIPDNGYLDYVKKIENPDLNSGILIEIPAFADPELENTIASALHTAANPNRVHFAICLQAGLPGQEELLRSVPHCRYIAVSESETDGTCRARHDCQQMLDNEAYTMRTDSHMRFAAFWDIALIRELSRCPEKTVISTFPFNCAQQSLLPPDDPFFTKSSPAGLCAVVNAYTWDAAASVFRCKSSLAVRSEKPIRGALLAGCFTFAKSDYDREVPIDPYLWFCGDEIATAARTWTFGWNVMHPSINPIRHIYNREQAANSRGDTVKRFPDRKDRLIGLRKREQERICNLFFKEGEELGEYGPGSVRTVRSFLEYAGLDPACRRVRRYAAYGRFDIPHCPEDMEWIPMDQKMKS